LAIDTIQNITINGDKVRLSVNEKSERGQNEMERYNKSLEDAVGLEKKVQALHKLFKMDFTKHPNCPEWFKAHCQDPGFEYHCRGIRVQI
jgi:hypothetical protein